MRPRPLIGAVLAAGLFAGPAPADAPTNAAAPGAAPATSAAPTPAAAPSPAAASMQPPMNTFDFAFYDCAAGAFEIDYDSETPTQATIVTSNHNQKYELTRVATQTGVQFAGRGVKFWTDGKKVLVPGTAIPLESCRLKGK